MNNNRALPWIFLLILLFVIIFSAGVKRGSYVEKENIKKQLGKQKAALSPPPSPNLVFAMKKIEGPCDVSYLLPQFVATESADIKIECDTKNASDSGELVRDGYERTPVPRSNPLFYVWTHIPTELRSLLQESLQMNNK